MVRQDTFKFNVMSQHVRMYYAILTPVCIYNLFISLPKRTGKSKLAVSVSATRVKQSTVDLYLQGP